MFDLICLTILKQGVFMVFLSILLLVILIFFKSGYI